MQGYVMHGTWNLGNSGHGTGRGIRGFEQLEKEADVCSPGKVTMARWRAEVPVTEGFMQARDVATPATFPPFNLLPVQYAAQAFGDGMKEVTCMGKVGGGAWSRTCSAVICSSTSASAKSGFSVGPLHSWSWAIKAVCGADPSVIKAVCDADPDALTLPSAPCSLGNVVHVYVRRTLLGMTPFNKVGLPEGLSARDRRGVRWRGGAKGLGFTRQVAVPVSHAGDGMTGRPQLVLRAEGLACHWLE